MNQLDQNLLKHEEKQSVHIFHPHAWWKVQADMSKIKGYVCFSYLTRLKHSIRNQRFSTALVSTFILVLLSLFVFSFIHKDPTLADPDSFYHARMALLTKEQGPVTAFPWLPFTILNDTYTDHHLLYHVLLIPFVSFLDPLIGMKVATVVFASGFILTFYLILKRLAMKNAFFFALVLIFITSFIYRINLAKAASLSLILLFLGIYCILQKRFFWLFIVSFLYVWSYGGFLLLPLTVVIYPIALLWGERVGVLIRMPQKELKQTDTLAKEEPQDTNIIHERQGVMRTMMSCFSGVAFSVLLHPSFPQNLLFYWHQIVTIGILNMQHVISVGAEWYPYPFIDLFRDTYPLVALFLAAFVLFSISLPQQKTRGWLSFFLVLLFGVATVKSRRYVEYFVPIVTFFSALSFSNFSQAFSHRFQRLNNILQINKIFPLILLVGIYLFFDLTLTARGNIINVQQSYQKGYALTTFQEVSSWLKDHTQEGDIIFHSDWDEFPMLFYHNTKNRYIAGLDPTFLFKSDEALYKKYAAVTHGEERENLYEIIKSDFRAKYIFVDTTHAAFKKNLEENFLFELVFSGKDGWIYEVL